MTQVNDGNEPEENEEVMDLFADGADEALVNEVADEAAAGVEPNTDSVKEDAPAGSSIPSKFEGKSAAEIANSYAELEREFSRRGNEIGELRKVTDDILKAQLSPKPEAPQELDITSDDLLGDPQAAVARAVANSPEVKALRESAAKVALQASQERFVAAHPDGGQVINSPEFSAWINANPVRAARFAEANDKYDFDSASEIVSTYKEIHVVTAKAKDTATAKRKADLDGVRGAKPGASNPGNQSKGKILLRSDLMKLRVQDPERYSRLGPQIQQAYAEGRVR